MIAFQWPFTPHIVTRGFDYRDSLYEGGIHKAIDIVKDFDGLPGDPEEAVADGWLRVNPFQDHYGGWTCWIDLPSGWRIGYYHLMQPTHIPDRTWVTAGTVIGYMGATGAAVGVHLHLIFWHRQKQDDTALSRGDWWAHNPTLYLGKEEDVTKEELEEAVYKGMRQALVDILRDTGEFNLIGRFDKQAADVKAIKEK